MNELENPIEVYEKIDVAVLAFIAGVAVVAEVQD